MEIKAENMIPVPINEFINGSVIPVNLYIRLGDQKFVLFCKSGAKTDKGQLETYNNKKVEYLWIRKEEYSKLARNNIMIAGMIVNQQTLTVAQKTDILSKAAATVFIQLDHVGLGFESYSFSKQIVEATVTMAEQHNDIHALLMGLRDVSEPLLRHSMAVCAVSVLIAQAMGWENKQTVEKLALGALLHDVGKKTLPPDLLLKPKAIMTFDEVQLYETHPYKGMQMLLSLGVVPDDVVAVVYEHHENAIGQGYPRKLRNLKMHPLAKIVAVADEFCNLTMENPNCRHPKNPREAILTIEHTMGQPHNREAFQALQMVVSKEYLKTAG